ncbi:MAG: bifunctional hydroxymethylpyrimidine kinase/phosphomethylpyrimidine kinase [Chloroflexota bacterium]|nr:bifunctional hydroxymethylpyrimidine kinase/phosphomethylpyrimidine kinase [Chloroflexota bacterium]
MIPRALTIAGSDSGAGAGIQADLKTFAAYGVYGTSAITAVTAQNTLELRDQYPLPAQLVAAQIDAVLADIGATAVKTGMLANAQIIRAVAAQMREHTVDNLVVDPVMVSSHGEELLEPQAVSTLIRELLPLALIVTPNLPETQIITNRNIKNWDDAKGAAAQIVEMGARNVLITGGHFEVGHNATDLLFDGGGYRDFTAIRIDTTSTHGTGCTLSAAIAAGLAKGLSVADAVALAKSYVTLAMQHAYPVGHGRGPLHHFYRYWQPTGRRYRPGLVPQPQTRSAGV